MCRAKDSIIKSRFKSLRNILQERSELDGLVSINKLSDINQRFSLIKAKFGSGLHGTIETCILRLALGTSTGLKT